MLHLFSKHYKLNQCFTTKYFDFRTETIKISALKRQSSTWSESEKFMLKLALHLFNSSNKVDLSGMDYLDDHNTRLAIEAIAMRYEN
ncbi:hypothetical protein HMPREF0083_02115 [Aneurinibacillus aneurinilyticus ATCC 12856]|uniref:Uncharacterized protein n=1 Tax=Aneurinibacillus aneurinilyticus ATCC 12856 TaxID=649747 RepID=U1YG49_ANEAE|nr:hypothetical protein HMPREF0083_02115 [Aneurinibacillus aneurinilyticus ATCC 12856]